MKTYEDAVTDALVYGTGMVKLEDGSTMHVTAVPPREVFISPYLLGLQKSWEQEVDFNE